MVAKFFLTWQSLCVTSCNLMAAFTHSAHSTSWKHFWRITTSSSHAKSSLARFLLSRPPRKCLNINDLRGGRGSPAQVLEYQRLAKIRAIANSARLVKRKSFFSCWHAECFPQHFPCQPFAMRENKCSANRFFPLRCFSFLLYFLHNEKRNEKRNERHNHHPRQPNHRHRKNLPRPRLSKTVLADAGGTGKSRKNPWLTTKTCYIIAMTKKHFEFIAATIAAMPDFADTLRAQKASCASSFADALQKTNPRFDRARFIKACNLRAD